MQTSCIAPVSLWYHHPTISPYLELMALADYMTAILWTASNLAIQGSPATLCVCVSCVNSSLISEVRKLTHGELESLLLTGRTGSQDLRPNVFNSKAVVCLKVQSPLIAIFRRPSLLAGEHSGEGTKIRSNLSKEQIETKQMLSQARTGHVLKIAQPLESAFIKNVS